MQAEGGVGSKSKGSGTHKASKSSQFDPGMGGSSASVTKNGRTSWYKKPRHISHNPFNTFRRLAKPIINSYLDSLPNGYDKEAKARLMKKSYWSLCDEFKKIEGPETSEIIYERWIRQNEGRIIKECMDDMNRAVNVHNAAMM